MQKLFVSGHNDDTNLQEVYAIFLDGVEIVIACSAWSGLKIGLRKDFTSQHMSAFDGLSGQWSNFSTGWKRYTIHFKQDPETKSLWCNFGENLPVYNNEFPYLFMNGIQWASFHNLADRKKKEIRDVFRQCPNA